MGQELLSDLMLSTLSALRKEWDAEAARRVAEAGESDWMVSFDLWSGYLRFIGESGTTVRKLVKDSGVSRKEDCYLMLGGMERWRFVLLSAPEGARDLDRIDHRRYGLGVRLGFGSTRGIRGDLLVCLTPRGVTVLRACGSIVEGLETGWGRRLGEGVVALRGALETVSEALRSEP